MLKYSTAKSVKGTENYILILATEDSEHTEKNYLPQGKDFSLIKYNSQRKDLTPPTPFKLRGVGGVRIKFKEFASM